MKNIKNTILATIITALVLTGSLVSFAQRTSLSAAPSVTKPVEYNAAVKSAVKEAAKKPVVNENNFLVVKPLAVVANPSAYLGKQVKFRASFDKFSTLGLDYKPAFRDSQKYISFLIKRDDVTDHTIPLSEMKIFIKRDYAEKFIDLDSGDIIEVYGKVFSDALTDAWVDVEKLVIISKNSKDKSKKA